MRHLNVGLLALAVLVSGSQTYAAMFQGLGDLPGGAFSSDAAGISADGLVVVGSSSYTYNVFGHSLSEAFRWTLADGMVGLGRLSGGHFSQSYASAASGDGSVIVGGNMRWTEPTGIVLLPDGIGAADVSSDGTVIVGSVGGPFYNAFRWTEAGGTNILPYQGFGRGVSGDGSVVVGMHWHPAAGAGGAAPSRWTEAEGTVPLVVGSGSGSAVGASADGSVIVGYFGGYTNPGGAFRWTAADGMVPLGDLPGGGFESSASDVSADGSVVVGFGTSDLGHEAFIWDATNEMRSVKDVLTGQGLDLV